MNEITPFNYSDLSATEAAELEAVTARIKDRLTRQVSDIIETGRDLIEVKSKLQHGQFEAWLNLSFNMTMRTAQKYMRAAEWMADKSELGSYLTPTTVYMLSAKSTPEGVHEQVVERLEKGLPAEPEYVRHVVQEARIKKGQADQKARTNERRREQTARTEEHQDAGQVIIGGPSYDALCRAWNACSEDEQGRFLVNIGWITK